MKTQPLKYKFNLVVISIIASGNRYICNDRNSHNDPGTNTNSNADEVENLGNIGTSLRLDDPVPHS